MLNNLKTCLCRFIKNGDGIYFSFTNSFSYFRGKVTVQFKCVLGMKKRKKREVIFEFLSKRRGL